MTVTPLSARSLGARTQGRRTLTGLASVALIVAIWELIKWLVPENGVLIAGVRVLPRTGDGSLPHVWSVLRVLGQPEVRVPGSRTVGEAVSSAAFFSFRLALVGFVVGTVVGVALALLMQRFTVAERALLPYVIASQTVPLVALAPLVAGWGGKITIAGSPWQPWMSVSLIASYLAFFPVSVGMLRGLASPSVASVELMHCYAIGWWGTLLRLRLPASIAHLIPALRLAAAAAVIGAVIAEISTGTRGGIGRLIIEYAQQSTSDSSKLFAAILAAAVLGLLASALVALLERGLSKFQSGVNS